MRVFVIVMGVILLAAVGAGGYFIGQSENAREQVQQLRTRNLELRDRLSQLENRISLFTHQLESEFSSEEGSTPQVALPQDTAEDSLKSLCKAEIQRGEAEVEALSGRLALRLKENLLFAPGDSVLIPAGMAFLNRLREGLQEHSERLVRVEVHWNAAADTSAAPWLLPLQRARSILFALQPQPPRRGRQAQLEAAAVADLSGTPAAMEKPLVLYINREASLAR